MSTNTVSHVGRHNLAGLTATGTTQATAFPLLNETAHQFTTVAASTGAVLPVPKLPSSIVVWNGGANTLAIYPSSGGKVNDGATDAAYSLTAASGISFFAADLSTWYTTSGVSVTSLSALLDALDDTPGDVLVRSDVGWGALLPGTNGQVLGSQGDTDAPAWQDALPAIADKAVLGNTSGGTAAAAGVLLSAMIDEAIGGVQGDILYRDSTDWQVLAPGTNGQILASQGASANPHWITGAAGTGTVTSVVIGTGLASTQSPLTSTGTMSLATIADKCVLGNTTGGTAAPGAVTLSAMIDEAIGTVQGDILYRGASLWSVLAPGTSGFLLASQGASANPHWIDEPHLGTVTSVATGSGLTGGTITATGTLSLATIADKSVLANTTGGTAAPAGVLLTAVIDEAIGNVQGDILYRDAAAWKVLPPGDDGQVLSTHGAAANPEWITNSGTGISELTGDVMTASGSGAQAAFFAGQGTAITPSISASQDDWSPAGWLSSGAAVANVIRVSVTASGVNLTGLVPPSAGVIDGAIVTIFNAFASSFPLRIKVSSASSSAANRFGFKSDVFLDPGESVALQYNSTASLWHELCPHKWWDANLWGSAADGTGPTTGTTFTRSMHYDDWTIPAGQVFVGTGFDIYVSGTLDISAASAGSITFNGGNGGSGNANGGAGTAAAVTISSQASWLSQDVGRNGGAGGTSAGTVGVNAVVRPCFNALNGGLGGAGGAGNSAAGGNSGTSATATAATPPFEYRSNPYVASGVGSVAPIVAGQGSSSGGGGGGDSTNSGGGGGGAGVSGGCVRIFARKINRGTNSATAIIQAKGGNGGAGGTPTAGNTGGGGGGGGGSGGTVAIYHSGIFGTQITNAIDVSGGNGGSGGSLHGASGAANGNGASSGPGGYVVVMNMATGTAAATSGSARVAASGQTGGTAATSQANL